MKKGLFICSVIGAAIIGGSIAGLITNSRNNSRKSVEFARATGYSDFHFVENGAQKGSLPDFTTAAEKGVKSVVNIEIVRRVAVRGGGEMDMFEYFFGTPQGDRQDQEPQYREQKGGGSGVIISEDGYIISNNHVIENADEIKITTHNGDAYIAKVIGTDPSTDISLLKIDAKDLSPLSFGNSDNLRLGEWVLAIGNPYGLTSTVTQGIISAKGRSMGMSMRSQLEIESFIQTDAVVNPGNSGGALITLDGNLIGINTMLFSPTGSYSGYSFAVPSSIVRKVVTDLRKHGVVQRAMLGIEMVEVTAEWLEKFGKETGVKERGGIYIGNVLGDGAAAAAGIKKGDILTHINDAPINTAAEVQEAIGRHRPNDKVNISVKRDGKVKHFNVTLRNKAGNTDVVTKQSYDLTKALGAQFQEITDKQKSNLKIKHGVQVVRLLDPKGILARSRVKTGFIITSINDIPITKVSQIETLNIPSVETIEGVYPDGSRATYTTIAK